MKRKIEGKLLLSTLLVNSWIIPTATADLGAAPAGDAAAGASHHRITAFGAGRASRLNLTDADGSYIPRFLRSSDTSLGFALRRHSLRPLGAASGGDAAGANLRGAAPAAQLTREDFQVDLDGVPVRGFHLTEIYDGDRLVQGLGVLPTEEIALPTGRGAAWASPEEVAVSLQRLLAGESGSHPLKIGSSRQVYFYDGSSAVIAAWEIEADIGGKPHLLHFGAGKLLARAPLFFDAAGVAEAYPQNPSDGAPVEIDLEGLTGNGYLETEHFKTETNDQPKAQAADHRFIYPETDARFVEVNAFTHLLDIRDWYAGMGYQWHTPGRLVLTVNDSLDGDPNNAYYLPNGGYPYIKVGNGDGVILQNLGLDADVVGHEFGHHIIFQYLQSTGAEESLVMHEGLADFFTFAKSGDPCLGESICPADSPVCEVRGQCLRTADNDLNYESDAFEALQPHQKGQLISGILWDLNGQGGLDLDAIARLLFQAISFLPAEAIYEDLFLSLLTADSNLNKGKNTCLISETFEARGFGSFTGKIDCKSVDVNDFLGGDGNIDSGSISGARTVINQNSSGTSNGGSSSTRSSKRSKGSGGFGCGTVGGSSLEAAQGGTGMPAPVDPLLIILLAAAPLVSARRRG